jgi:tRNA(Ile)-lysidine synthase
MSLIESTRRTIRRYGLLPPGSRVVIALSGGADSVGMLCALTELAATEGFDVVGVAHLNHQIRGSEADTDELFCRRLAEQFALPIHAERLQVAARAAAAGISIEHAAHDARLEVFARAAAGLNASAVAVAHTKNDQAETFLLRLLRGAGPRGLGGMHPRSGVVVRPFIETDRDDVRQFLAARKMAFRLDATNQDMSIPRNRIRHELLPLLETRFAPGVVDILDREAAIAREDAAYLDEIAAATAERLVARTPAGIEFSAEAIRAQPPAIARRVIRHAQQLASGGRFVGFDAVDAVLVFAVSKSAGSLDLPGHRVNRRGDTLVLTKSAGRPAAEDRVEFTYELGVPGHVRIPEAACAISAEISSVPSGQSAPEVWALVGRGEEAVLEASKLTAPLAVRNRRPGDSFRPLGLQGRKKLQDLFVDAKVDRAARDTTPVIANADGNIVWVAGHAVAEEFRVTDRTTAVVILRRVSI